MHFFRLLFSVALLLPMVSYAGTNTLPYETGRVIERAHVNKFQTALTADLVPRNTSGTAQSEAGSLGSSTFRWANTYTDALKLWANGNAISLLPYATLPASYSLTFPGALPVENIQPLVSSSGAITFGRLASASSSSSGQWVSPTPTTSYADVTPLSVTATTFGGNVLVTLQPDAVESGREKAIGCVGTGLSCYLRIVRDGSTVVGVWPVFGVQLQKLSIFLDRSVPAGSHTYKVQYRYYLGSSPVYVEVDDLVLSIAEIL